VDWWWRGGRVAVVVNWGFLVNWWWRTVARSRVLAVEWRSSGGDGQVLVGVAVERAVAVAVAVRAMVVG
jgi:hypothetical protein